MELVLFESEFDIIKKLVVGCIFCKVVGRSVPDHEGTEFIVVESRDFFNDIPGKSVVDKFILLIIYKPVLESLQAAVSLKPEHIDDLVQVQSCISVGAFRDFKSRFFIIEDLLIVFTVLEGIHMIVPGRYAHFIQYRGIYMQGDIESAGFVHNRNGKKLGSAAEIGKTKGIGLFKTDHIVSVGIRGCPGTTAAKNRYPVQGMGSIHIKYSPVNGNLLGGSPECTNGEKGKYNRFPEICVEKNQTLFF